jgi:hypothetical protein
MNQAIIDRLAADGSKVMVTVKFQFAEVEHAVATICNKKVDSLFYNGMVATQTFATTMTNRRLGRSGNMVRLLSDEQINMLIAEDEAPVKTRFEMEDLFSFMLRRIPNPGRSRVEFHWGIEVLRDQRSTSDQIDCNVFVMTQLIRFGILDKLPPRKK